MFLLSGCSVKVNRTVHHAPTIRVSHEGKIISVDLESYVASVLAGEVHESWPMEALKAQAVAARTFAVRRMRERNNRAFHIQSSIIDQVYKAHNSARLKAAAKATFGLVLSFDNRLAEASFHSTCGGKTTNSKYVWGQQHPYLKGVTCNYCRSYRTFSWQETLPVSLLENKFNQQISRINILTRSEDGRALQMELIGSKRQKLSAHELRMALSPTKIKSTFIKEINLKDSHIKINGNGFGHGVGLCQYGARGMAKEGRQFKDILAHYYPGTKLTVMY